MVTAAMVDLMNEGPFRAVRPTSAVLIGGRPVRPLTIDVDMGYDVVSAAASVTLAAVPAWLASGPERQTCEIRLGYNGLAPVTFASIIEDEGLRYFPFDQTLQAVGRLRLAQYDYPSEVTYENKTDVEIVEDLLERAGISQHQIAGEGTTFGTVAPVVLQAGQPVWSLINRLDQVTGCRTFDCPDGTVRRLPISGLPSASAAWTYEEGVNILAVRRRRATANVRNRVTVTGLRSGEGTFPSHTQYAGSPYVPDPPRYVQYRFDDELIESEAYAETVALRLMAALNRRVDELELEVPGNPLVYPGQTIKVISAKMGLPAGGNYWCKHIKHRKDSSGFVSILSLEGGIGDSGYAAYDPVAAFTWFMDQENFEVGGSPTQMYTVVCDGSGSYDADGPPDGLTYSWSNSVNADTGTERTYSTAFTAAELAAGPTITLTVTDLDSDQGTVTQTITGSAATTPARTLYVAAGARAEATTNGGELWNTWAPASGNIIATPEGAADDHSYFGADDGKLYHTADALMSAPTLVHTFGSAVKCVWIHETDRDRVTVGCQDGTIHQTTDASELAAATWAQIADLGEPIEWVAESPMQLGQIWACAGRYLEISFDNGANWAAYATFPSGATARKFASSFMGNFVCASVGAGESPIRDDADTEYTMPAMAPDAEIEDVRAISHHLYDDVIWACDLAGRFLEGSTAGSFSHVGTVTEGVADAGNVNHMVRDTGHQAALYLACDDALVKTFDAGRSFVRMRDYTGAGLQGHQVGIGSLALRVTTGRRVYVAGDGPKVAYTENIWEASPVWVDISTGLPADASGPTHLVLDAVDANVGYLVSNGILYANTNLTGGGTWVAIGNSTIFNGLYPRWPAFAFDFTSQYIQAVCAVDDGSTGVLLAFVEATAPASTTNGIYLFYRSTDRGSTWTPCVDEDDPPNSRWGVRTYHDWAPRAGPGTHQSGKVYTAQENTVRDTAGPITLSGYGGGWADPLDPPLAAGAGATTELVCPGGAVNPSDLKCFLAADGELWYTSNGGNAWTKVADTSYVPVCPPDAAAETAVLGGLSVLRGKYSIGRSADWGATWATVYTFGTTQIRDFVADASTRWYAGGESGGGSHLYTCTTDALDAWTERTGNLGTIMTAPKRLAVDPTV